MPEADTLIGDESVKRLAACMQRAGLKTDAVAGLNLDGLRFTERSDAVGAAFTRDLPDGFEKFAATCRRLAADEEFRGWLIWPVGIAVARRAVAEGSADAIDQALDLLELLTPGLTCEAALRPLLDADLERVLNRAQAWTGSDNEHVRRLASEGTRPLLPWAPRVRAISADPQSTIPILNALYRDSSETVRRSVANHLNDISRSDPQLATNTVAGWLEQPDENTDRVAAHALRTLVKQGDPQALSLLGFATADDVEVDGPILANTEVAQGEDLRFTVRLRNLSSSPVRIAIDYVVHYRKANGALSPKVFKLRTLELAPDEQALFERSRSFKPITTRRFHPGEHLIEVQVNGTRHGATAFTLVADAPY